MNRSLLLAMKALSLSLTLLGSLWVGQAQTTIDGSAISAGAGSGSAGVYSLDGTLGQVYVGSRVGTLGGAAVQLIEGFWAADSSAQTLAPPLPTQQPASFLVVKGLVFAQSSTSAPPAIEGAVFEAAAPDFGGPPMVSGGSLTLPSGATQALVYQKSASTFWFADTAATAAALDAAYPAGHYLVTLNSSLIPGLIGGMDLAPADFPTSPQVLNLAAAQIINASNDFTLAFQPFTGAAASDDAAIEVYDAGSLLFSDPLALTDTSYVIPGGRLDPGKTYEGRIRFRHLHANPTAFPPTGYGFFGETRFALNTRSIAPTPPKLLEVQPGTGVTLQTAEDGVLFVFDVAMDTNRAAIQWSATLNGSPFTLSPTNFTYAWIGAPALSCHYAQGSGGWPAGLVVTWTLNPAAGSLSNFADSQGTALPINTFTGSFRTPGLPCNCPPPSTQAADWAPETLAGSLLTITVSGGTAPLAATGVYQVFTTLVGTNFLVLGNAGGALSGGTYTYTKTGTNGSTVVLGGSAGGAGAFSATLTYRSATSGTLSLSGAGGQGAQQGAFTVATYGQSIDTGLVVPTFTNGQFQAYVGGREGVNVAVEASSDFNHWSPLARLAITNLTAGFSDSNAASGQAQFYRVSVGGSAFAPDTLAGRTLNLSVTGGAAPFPTNGTWQWLGGTNGNAYQIRGMTATTNAAGAYTYTNSSPDSARLSLTDAQSGANQRLDLAFASPTQGFYYSASTNSAGSQRGTFTLADGPVDFLGNLQFTTDTNRAASLSFAADGHPSTLSVTNADGYIWTLNFPADALLTPGTITMTPFAKLDSSASLVPMVSGVRLEPDGIRFHDGVTLTVTAPKPLTRFASMMLANHDGGEVHFVPSTNLANTYSTTLLHFTSGAVADYSGEDGWQRFLDDHLPQAQAAYNQAAAQVNALKRVVVQPPEPPDYEYYCDPQKTQAQDAAVDAFIERLFARESEAIKNLLSAARILALLGAEPSDDLALAEDLIHTAGFRKIDALFRDYQSNPKKFTPVVKATLNLMRNNALLGGTEDPSYWDRMRVWGTRVRDYYLNRLKQEHDYSMVSVILGIERQLELLGGGDPTSLKSVEDAMAFNLDVTINAVGAVAPADQISESVHGNLDMDFHLECACLDGPTATLRYVSGSQPGATLKLPLSFNEEFVVHNLELCTNWTATINMDPIVLDETWIWPPPPQGPGALTAPSYLGGYFGNAFAHDPGPLGYAFKLPMHNKQVEAINESITKEAGEENVTIKFVLRHTPH